MKSDNRMKSIVEVVQNLKSESAQVVQKNLPNGISKQSWPDTIRFVYHEYQVHDMHDQVILGLI